jgi:hypothetical protein
MTHDEIMAMAREAGFRTGQINLSNGPPVPFIAPASGTSCMFELERFAALVASAEREACAALIESTTERSRWIRCGINGTPIEPCQYAAAIRARGKP